MHHGSFVTSTIFFKFKNFKKINQNQMSAEETALDFGNHVEKLFVVTMNFLPVR